MKCGENEYELANPRSYGLQGPEDFGPPIFYYSYFDYKIALAKITFTSKKEEIWTRFPKNFNIVGSDDCKTWHTLKEVTNPKCGTWNIPCESQELYYQCYGIQALAPLESIWALDDYKENIQMTSKTNALGFDIGIVEIT